MKKTTEDAVSKSKRHARHNAACSRRGVLGVLVLQLRSGYHQAMTPGERAQVL